MALTVDEQKLYNVALAALPEWYRHDGRRLEDLAGAAKCIGAALATSRYWMGLTLISQAVGPTGDDPDWLNQHARDRGTNRQAGESDAALRERIRNIPDAVTRPALLDATQDMVDAAGVVGAVAMVELRRDRAFLIVNTADAGVGGTFTTGSPATFLPDGAGFAAPPFQDAYPNPPRESRLLIAGAASGGNDGSFVITGLDDDAAEFTNGLAVAGHDATVTWRVNRYGAAAELITPTAADRRDAYCDRGYRCGPDYPAFVIMLPFGSTESLRVQVAEMVRQKKAAGVLAIVERRLNP